MSYSPMPYRYGVIRLDSVWSVKHLDDPVAIRQAEILQNKRYLVYLEHQQGLPFPDMLWYRFTVNPIATTLRAENIKDAITPEMCIPIYPNTVHPEGRRPLHTTPEFPFSNCYHWFATSVDVPMRAMPDAASFDESHAVRLSALERTEMQFIWSDDNKRRYAPRDIVGTENHAQRDDTSTSSAPCTDQQDPSSTPQIDDSEPVLGPLASAASPRAPSLPPSDDADDRLSYTASDNGDSESTNTEEGLAKMDIFTGEDEAGQHLPLFDFPFDLRTLDADDIPIPLEFFSECNSITRIIKESLSRTHYQHVLRPQHQVALNQEAVAEAQATGKQARLSDAGRIHEWSLPADLRRKLHVQGRPLLRRIRYTFRLPYIAIWP